MPRLVDVALPLPLEGLFTYHLPADLEESAEPGMRALVQFRRDTLTGVIVRRHNPSAAPNFKTKPVLDLPDPEPVFDAAMLSLTKWVADYYLASWGETLRTALPQGIAQKSRWMVRPRDTAPHAVAALLSERAPAQARLLRLIADRGEMTLSQLRRVYGGPDFHAALRALEADGRVAVADEGHDPEATVKTELTVRLGPSLVVDNPDARRTLGSEQTRLLEGLRTTGAPTSLALIRRAWGISSDTVRRLERRGLLVVEQREVFREPDLGEIEPEVLHPLTPHQREALDLIAERLDARTFAAIVLHGVTDSGKTRVYLDAIERVVNEGGGAIVLVPEISLTPQTVRRFRSRFGDQVAVLHSQLSVGERYDAWRQLRAGRRRVAVGPRSAVFAPVQAMRLIVVDEEHDSSYKQDDPGPRYHARDVAVMRAQQSDAVAILGSATPSLETLDNVRRRKYQKIELPERIDHRRMPEVAIVDMRKERADHNFSSLSRDLRRGIQSRLDKSEQVVILQNRRGYSPVVQCLECGEYVQCRDCEVTMTYHQADNRLKCHYCGEVQLVPRTCPSCKSADLRYGGAGTQKVQEEVLQAFPDTPLIRMDHDTTRGKNAHNRLLEQFRHRQAMILLGTQMVAKGLDFPNVTLVGVISGDIGLALPDFRAAERTFQLLTQVAGRTGRGEVPGEVVFQTYQPDHPAIVMASRHDVAGFASYELAQRRHTAYPPYGRLILIQLRGRDFDKTQSAADHLGRIAVSLAPKTVEVLGPSEAPIAKLKKHWRWHILLKGESSAALRRLARQLREQFENIPDSRSIQLSIDVDPMTMM
jgi:primosomal protein N' (replication factor Y)